MGNVGGNKWAIDYDKPGFCVLCHSQIADFDGFNKEGNPANPKIRAIYRESSFLLDDRSTMRTSMCKDCYETFIPKDSGKIMESVINGWQWEIQHGLGKWLKSSQEQRHMYMKRYMSRYIVTRMDITWNDEQDKEAVKPLWKNLKAIPWDGSRENQSRIPSWAKERDPGQEGWVDSLDKEFSVAKEDDPIRSNQILRSLHQGRHPFLIAKIIEKSLKVREGSIKDKATLIALAKSKGDNPSKEDVEEFLGIKSNGDNNKT